MKRRHQASGRTLHDRLRRFFRRGQKLAGEWRRSAVQWVSIFLVLLLLLGIGLFFFSPIVTLREFRIARADPRLDIDQLQEVLSPYFGEHLLFLSTVEMETLLEDAIPDSESVIIEKVFPSEVIVEVILQPLVAELHILDPEEVTSAAAGTGVIIDFLTDQGMYVQVPTAEEEDLTVLSLVDWGVRPVPGTELLDRDFLERIESTERALHSLFGFNVLRRTVFLRAQEFHLDVGEKVLWFDMRTDLQDQLQRYRTFLRHISMDEVENYVDLRLSDRVVYK